MIPPIPQLAESAQATPAKAVVKPAGTYRPPGTQAKLLHQSTSSPMTVGMNEASSSALASSIATPEPLAAEGGLDLLQKKICNLMKKVRFQPCWCVAVYNGVLTLIFPSAWPLWNHNSVQGY